PPSSPLFPSTTLFRSLVDRLTAELHLETGAVRGARRVDHPHEIGLGQARGPRVELDHGERGVPVMRDLAGRLGSERAPDARDTRSEEHTSELQSLAYL